MNCKNIDILFDDFQEKRLSDDQLHSFIDHLKNCTTCKEKVELYQAAYNFIDQDKKNNIKSDLFENIAEKIKHVELNSVSVVSHRFIPYIAASIILFFSIISGYILGNNISEKVINENYVSSFEDQLFDDDLNFDLLNE